MKGGLFPEGTGGHRGRDGQRRGVGSGNTVTLRCVVSLAAEVGEGCKSQITKGFVSQLEESKLRPLG